MSDAEALTLHPAQHDKLGSVHCGVTREGFVSVAGDTGNIEDGQELTFPRVAVKVVRSGGDYTFSRT